MSKLILEALLTKWEVRCTIISEAHLTTERAELCAEATKLWEERKQANLLAQDRALYDKSFAPEDTWTTKQLRNWIDTRNLAAEAAREVHETQKSTLMSWLVPRRRNETGNNE